MRRMHFKQHLILLSLCAAINCLLASPVSNPEILSKTNKSIINNGIGGQQQNKMIGGGGGGPQDAHLNSLTVYATNYDTISQGGTTSSQDDFKPSYKLPQMETNFTPIQTGGGVATMGTTAPVLMQYMPHVMHDGGGVHYLQFIPTRPLIVPITQFLPGGGALPATAYQTNAEITTGNSIADYAGRPMTLITAVPTNTAPPQPNPIVDVPTNLQYGLHTYANTIQPYRTGANYRINREIKGNNKQLPMGMSLNLNEYLPGPHDAPHPQYIRGRA